MRIDLEHLPVFQDLPKNPHVAECALYSIDEGRGRLGFTVGVFQKSFSAGPMSAGTESYLMLCSETEKNYAIGASPISLIPLSRLTDYVALDSRKPKSSPAEIKIR